LQFLPRKRGERPVPIAPEFTQVGDKVIASSQWAVAEGRYQERLMVFTFRDGKIIDMQGCASRREAEQYAKRR
jgi:hypothetical protein